MDDARYQSLVEDDLNHWVHPLFHSSGHQQPLLIERGEGVYVYGADGTRYIDGLAALWNVAVGHGRAELGEAAAAQMAKLGFNNSYEGYTNEPAIRLAKKVVGLAYPNMQALYFTNSGSEANETNFKAARFYWSRLGRPEKHKIISRVEAYHGNTIAMTTATGMKVFHGNFGPKVPNIINADTPDATPSGGGRIDAGNVLIDNIVATLEREGPDSVAAVIAEPVQGAGGVYPPPPDLLRAAARCLRPLRGAADRRRGDHRLRAHRQVVRARAFRCAAGHDVDRQGDHQRLRADGRGDLLQAGA